MVASAGGLDALVFTGGVGEHSSELRGAAVERLGWTGAAIDEELDRSVGDRRVSPDASSPEVWVLRAEEDVEIAAGVRAALVPPR
jgi:acetate kinase